MDDLTLYPPMVNELIIFNCFPQHPTFFFFFYKGDLPSKPLKYINNQNQIQRNEGGQNNRKPSKDRSKLRKSKLR